VATVDKRNDKQTCRATNRHGQPCGRLATNDGLCLVHAGRQDMRALGRAGGRKSPGRGKSREREHEPLRVYLRRVVDPADVWQAVKAALESAKQSDRLAGAKLLLAELYEAPSSQQEEKAATLASARAKLADKLAERARRMDAEQKVERASRLLREAVSDASAGEELAGRCFTALGALAGSENARVAANDGLPTENGA